MLRQPDERKRWGERGGGASVACSGEEVSDGRGACLICSHGGRMRMASERR